MREVQATPEFVTIEVRGRCNSGKSTIAYQIAKALADAGIDVQIHDSDAPTLEWAFFQDKRMEILKEKLQVDIYVTNTQRNGGSNERGPTSIS